MNIRLHERTFRLENLTMEIDRTKDNLAKHDEDMMKITRTLQKQIDEKNETIEKYEKKLKQLEQEYEVDKANRQDMFKQQSDNIAKHQETQLNRQEKQRRQLMKQKMELEEFKNVKQAKKQEIQNEKKRY